MELSERFPLCATSTTLIGLTFALLTIAHIIELRRRHGLKSHTLRIPAKPRWFYIGTPSFFMKPYDYVEEAMKWAKGSMFTFPVLGKNVVVLRGTEGRKAFFSKGLDFLGGYRLLNPQVTEIMPPEKITGDESWSGSISKFWRPELLAEVFPYLITDVSKRTALWGDQGTRDLFSECHLHVFAMSARHSFCREVCDAPGKVEFLARIFQRLDKGSEISSAVVPWFPTPARLDRLLAGKDLYMMVKGAVSARAYENRRESDALQQLIDQDLSLVRMVKTIAMALFSSAANSSDVVAWLLIFLGTHPETKQQVEDQLNEFKSSHNIAKTSPFSEWASNMDFGTFEQAAPIIEQCVDETVRLTMIATLMREYIDDEDMHVESERIKKGMILMYPLVDVHFDANLYPRPEKFDPAHFSSEEVARRAKTGPQYPWVGFGAARHVCKGRRVAMLMTKIIVLSIISDYDFEVTDSSGALLVVPPPFRRRLLQIGVPHERMFLKFSRKLPALS